MYNSNYPFTSQGTSGYNRATLLFVPTFADIDKVPVMPGEKLWVMAMDDAIMACRTGGNMGVTTTYCRMEEYVPAPPPKPEDYVTKADLEAMFARFMSKEDAKNE